jgi:hypothetical protein
MYVLSDPARARQDLEREAKRRGVPMPDWDLPPPDFDHDATLEAADVVLLVGNRFTLETFPAQWQHKIRLVNYSIDPDLWRRPIAVERRPAFVLAEANTGSIVAHGWIDSARDEYLALLRSCRFAFVPTWVEGQMGTLLEAVHAGCVPVTTRASGLDDRVLAHGVVVEARDARGQRTAVDEVLSWSDAEYGRRQAAVVSAVERHHNWEVFARQVSDAVLPALESNGRT